MNLHSGLLFFLSLGGQPFSKAGPDDPMNNGSDGIPEDRMTF